MIERLSFFMAGSAKGVLRQWYEANNPYEIAKTGKLVHVEIKGLPCRSVPIPTGWNGLKPSAAMRASCWIPIAMKPR